jgi:hypothetical protein
MRESDPIFKLEQEIMNCWNVVEDLDYLYTYIGDHEDFKGMDGHHSDKIINLLLGVKELYNVKFDKTFRTFEDVVKEYHQRGKVGADL